MTDSIVYEIAGRLTGVHHEAIRELHGLRTSSTQLAGYYDLTAFRSGLHDETKHTVASTADGKAPKKLVPERLALSDGGETTVLNLLGVELE